GFYTIKNLLVNPANRYMYFCYDCANGEAEFSGRCVNQQNNCIYVTSLQDYNTFGCVRPPYGASLYKSTDACLQSIEPSEINCFTRCVDGFYEEKTVIAQECSDENLLSAPPGSYTTLTPCINKDADTCTSGGVTYAPNEVFCFNDQISRCLGDGKLNFEGSCEFGCSNGKCLTEEGEPEEEEVVEKICCGYWDARDEKIIYSFKTPTLSGVCPIVSVTGILVSKKNLCVEGEDVEEATTPEEK
ncbi:unnamed protein product, partial [marine sediment metagenome]